MTQVALITGGGGGIGGAVAQRMAAAGITVVIADYDGGAAERVKGDIVAAGGKADALGDRCDRGARSESRGHAMCPSALGGSTFSPTSPAAALIPSASKSSPGREWKEVMDANLKGTFLMCREVAPLMQRQKNGRIINTASNYGVTGSALRTPYAAAKAGIITFTKSLALELAPDCVLANTVAPGPTDTPRVMEKESPEARKQRWWPQIPLGRTALPEDLAEMYYFLTTPESAAITGQTFHVNGGVVMP